MLRNILLSIMLIPVLVSSVSAEDWRLDLDAAPLSPNVTVIMSPNYTIGYDREPLANMFVHFSHIIGAAFKRENGSNGWNGDSGWYQCDFYPMIARGNKATIGGLCVHTGLDYTSDTFTLRYTWPYGIADAGNWIVSIRLVDTPDGVVYDGPTQWTIPVSATKQRGEIEGATFQAVKTDDLSQNYEYAIDITYVSEPSSLSALALGLLPVGAAVMRRRRR